MTDQEKFEAWWRAKWNDDCDDDLLPKDYGKFAFLAALAIGREEGRRERTVEIAEKLKHYWNGGYKESADARLFNDYPECFEKGEG